MITAKSLHKADIVTLLPEAGFQEPPNEVFAALYSGDRARGVRFLHDPIIKSKMLVLPEQKLRVVLEGRRLQVADEQGVEPDKSSIPGEIVRIQEALFGKASLAGYGFNFDCYFRFNNVLALKERFTRLFGNAVPLEGADLSALGIQFTLDRGGVLDTWFFKITAPLEIAVHVNRHFPYHALPTPSALHNDFGACYNGMDELVAHFERIET